MASQIFKTVFLIGFCMGLSACSAPDESNTSKPETADTASATPDNAIVTQAQSTVCEGFGPQTPRDIDSKTGSNSIIIETAPDYSELNLCNIHFHNPAEHKAKAFSASGDDNGYQCGTGQNLSEAEVAAFPENACEGIKPGDTIEVHWVHSSCDIQPGPGLGSCLNDGCDNPKLRVETQIFTLVNDPNALDFNTLDYSGSATNGLHQARHIPDNTGKPVVFGGSTTGPKYTEQQCSPLKVTWSVRPQCAKLHIGSLSEWCKSNAFEEDHAHGVRKLVTHPALLSEIK